MEFVALDVETANRRRHSVCQIGAVLFRGFNTPVEKLSVLVNPEERFEERNTKVHGISASEVEDCPNFPEVWEHLAPYLDGKVLVHHGQFDPQAFAQATYKYRLRMPDCVWLDTISVAEVAWPGSGHKLDELATRLGLSLDHHNAVSDATVAGQILLSACRDTGKGIGFWVDEFGQSDVQPAPPPESSGDGQMGAVRYRERGTRPGSQSGPYYGQSIVFTGALSSLSDSDAEDLAHSSGFRVTTAVSGRTSYLVVGQGPGQTKVSNAEKQIVRGKQLKMISEKQFLALVGFNDA